VVPSRQYALGIDDEAVAESGAKRREQSCRQGKEQHRRHSCQLHEADANERVVADEVLHDQ
jgi:hypothetical protein